MTDPRFEEIDRYLASAWAALCGARAVATRNPTGETLRLEGVAEDRVDWLLDKRRLRMTRAELDAAERRPVRKLVTA
jgi:hypothetical protein